MIKIDKNRYNQFLCTNRLLTDITGAAITFQIKENLDTAETALLELKNAAAGGSSAEIEDVDLSIGSIRLKMQETQTIMDAGWYWAEAKATISGEDYLLFQTKVEVEDVLI